MIKPLHPYLRALLFAPAFHAGQVFAQTTENDCNKYDCPFPVAKDATIGALANVIFQFGILLVVLAAAIYIGIGAYAYFIAAGNATMAEKGKAMIQRSVIGLLLALIAYVLLKAISPQFVDLPNPQFKAQ
jgi:RsiW-degrading membrane proteinase PrsW (M82 family)